MAYWIASLFAALWVGSDAHNRREGYVLHGLGAFVFAPIVVPIWLATRPLRAGETREGGKAWNILKNFSILWTLLMAVVGFAAMMAVGKAAAEVGTNEYAQAGAGIGMMLGMGMIGAMWFFPVLGALVLGLLLKKSTEHEVGPTGALADPELAHVGFEWSAGRTAALAGIAVVVAVASGQARSEAKAASPQPVRAAALGGLAVPEPAEVEAPVPVPAQQPSIEIVSVKTKELERNSVFTKYGYVLELRNNTSTPWTGSVKVKWLDKDNFPLGEKSARNLSVGPGQTETFNGYDLISGAQANNVASVTAELSRW